MKGNAGSLIAGMRMMAAMAAMAAAETAAMRMSAHCSVRDAP